MPHHYYKDAAPRLPLAGQADAAAIKTKVYNVSGQSPAYTAADLMEAVRRHLPEADLSIEPDPNISQLLQGISRLALDDTPLSGNGLEAGLCPGEMVADFVAEFRAHPDVYSLWIRG